jgi:hypothetical protein
MKSIVIVTSFWNRPMLLRGLYLSSKKSVRNKWRMLVVDNGSENENKQWLYEWSKNIDNLEIIRRSSYSQDCIARKSSAEHGAALDYAMSHLKGTDETIVIADSDIVWMKPHWDDSFLAQLENHEHVTTCRKYCKECPAPFLSAFNYNFIEKYSLSFLPRTDAELQVIRPTEMNDVGWMMNEIADERWKKLVQAPPGIGYSKALSITMDNEIIAEHLCAGRKKSGGRILKWSSGCMNILDQNIKEIQHQEKMERKKRERINSKKRSL